MPNIRIDLGSSVINGQTLTFKSPADCSAVTGLIVYYPDGESTVSKIFQFADSHGNDVGSVSLFAENVLVKVILDTELNRAYVQNADTNQYLEEKFASKLSMNNGVISDLIILEKNKHYGDSYPESPVEGQLFFISLEAVSN